MVPMQATLVGGSGFSIRISSIVRATGHTSGGLQVCERSFFLMALNFHAQSPPSQP